MQEHLAKMTDYNLWANKRLGKVVLELDKGRADQEVKSSFPSIKRTILHIWYAETIWLKRLQGEPLKNFPERDIYDDAIEDVVMQWLHRSNEWHEFVSKMGEGYFTRDCSYHTTNGTSFTTPVRDIITHCMNHSTFHRGQIVTMLRQLGVEGKLPPTDYIVYLRENQIS